MGQKVNPVGLRLGINRTWDSRWFADRTYAPLLHEDMRIRKFVEKRLAQAGVSRVVIERPAKKARITVHTARPGVVIGKKGADIEKLRLELTEQGDRLHLQVQDWGVGFDPENVAANRFGLQGIRERARLLGAEAVIDTAPGKGTRIAVEFPLLRQAQPDPTADEAGWPTPS